MGWCGQTTVAITVLLAALLFGACYNASLRVEENYQP